MVSRRQQLRAAESFHQQLVELATPEEPKDDGSILWEEWNEPYDNYYPYDDPYYCDPYYDDYCYHEDEDYYDYYDSGPDGHGDCLVQPGYHVEWNDSTWLVLEDNQKWANLLTGKMIVAPCLYVLREQVIFGV